VSRAEEVGNTTAVMCKHHDFDENPSKRLLHVGERYVICCKRHGTGAKYGVAEVGPAAAAAANATRDCNKRRREVMPAGHGCRLQLLLPLLCIARKACSMHRFCCRKSAFECSFRRPLTKAPKASTNIYTDLQCYNVAFLLVSQPFAACAPRKPQQAECTAAAAATAAVAAAQCSMFLVRNNLMRLESHPFVTKSFTSIANHV
jgi:hypothetical protein